MRARLRPSVLGALLVGTLAVAACGLRPTASEPDLGVPNPGGGGDLYPGAIIVCGPLARCDDLVAEIRRWAARRAPEHGDPAGITIHAIVDDAGRPVLIQRSGGGTSIGVVTFADGWRAATIVGCGVGIDLERCFTSP
jgi:hypothetical protein